MEVAPSFRKASHPHEKYKWGVRKASVTIIAVAGRGFRTRILRDAGPILLSF